MAVLCRPRLELRLYSTTGGQAPSLRASEPTVTQPLSKLVAIARATRRRLQHLALDIIGLLRGFKAFGEASRSLPGAPKRKQEQEHCQRDDAVAQRLPHPRGDPGKKRATHRRPRFPSSSRAWIATAMSPIEAAMNAHLRVSRCATRGRISLCTTSGTTARCAAGSPVPTFFMVRLQARTSFAGAVSVAKGMELSRKDTVHRRARPKS
jgi:hypothetical protein